MFTIVVYHRGTGKIISCIPLIFDRVTNIRQLDGILHNDYDYRIYCGMEPVLYKDEDGDIFLKPNAFIINSEMLK